MSGLFSKPKSPSPPKAPPPPPLVEQGGEASDFAMKRAQGRVGFKKTILTGELSPMTQKKTLLG